MDRINGLNTVDIGGGRRGFRKKNKAAGIAGTEVTEVHMNALQEEVLYCIEQSGQVPAINDWTQLWKAIGIRLGNLQVLVAPTTFYVNGTSGNDSNNGLSAGTAFATIQGAVNKITTSYIAMAGVGVQVANGTYNGFSVPRGLISSWNFQGNSASPGSVMINASTVGINAGRGITISENAAVVSGFSINSFYEAVVVIGSTAQVSNCHFTGSPNAAAIGAYAGSEIEVSGALNFTGTFNSAFFAGDGSIFRTGYLDAASGRTVTVTFSSATFTGAVVTIVRSGTGFLIPSQVTWSGTPTGKRFDALSNGTISSNGGGVNFIPGTIAGTTSTGGQYL
jgi:hypothetical protein